MKLTAQEKATLAKLDDAVLCFRPSSRHYDCGYYILRGDVVEQVSSIFAAALIRKKAVTQMTEAPEKKPPPGAQYYKRAKIVMDYDLENTFVCVCGHRASKSGWVTAHLNERLKYTCPQCQKKWVLENLFVEEV